MGSTKVQSVSTRVDYQYSLLCERQPYFKTQIYAPLQHNAINFTEMKPGSLQKFNFAVFYNPSEFDRGVNFLLETLQLSKAYEYVYILQNAWFSVAVQ